MTDSTRPEGSPGPAARLALLGGTAMFLELALIRWLAGSIWNLGYFPNLVLLGAFVGMGVGFVFHERLGPRASLAVFHLAPWLLLGLGLFVSVARPGLDFEGWGAVVGGELFFNAGPARSGGLGLLPLWFAGVVAVFACLCQWTAKLFARFEPLRAYTLDILGSCCGVAAFMAASRLEWPAASWFLLLAGAWVLCADPADRARWLVPVPLALLAFIAARQDRRLSADPAYAGPLDVAWSPYQKVELTRAEGSPMNVLVNGIPHQSMAPAQGFETSMYQTPYRARQGPPYGKVLVIGAGTGNDTAAALRSGASSVDAVEIDPVIARLGRLHHPLAPYSDPRVRLTVDDGRAFMGRSPGGYDLIVFALTDSLVKVSSLAQLRLENYLFTVESARRAFGLLAPGGDLVYYNYYRQEWLLDKIRAMLRSATGREPEVLLRRGDLCVLRVSRSQPSAEGAPASPAGDIPTDDWPFLYLERRGLPRIYAAAMGGLAGLVCLLLAALHGSGERGPGRLRLAFVLMGAAFLLLETKGIIQFSLLFGSTWRNVSLVLLAVLLLVLAANRTAAAFPGRRLAAAAWALLLLSCLGMLLVPRARLLSVGFWPRLVLAGLLTFSPVYFANLVFSAVFREQPGAERLFGWNLIGATLGGVLEYAGMAFGYAALGVAVLALYAGAFVLTEPFGRERA